MMPDWVEAIPAARLIEIALAALIIEATAFALWFLHRTERSRALRAVAAAAPGVFLLLAARFGLAEAPIPVVGGLLAVAWGAHLWDLKKRPL